jgi:predicted short-subunit dehydrogenase-like oxidoreductase (DUF2520 family)
VLGFVGAGSVGRTLASAFAAAGFPIVMAHARASEATDGAWAWARSPQECATRADVIFLTVPDDRIAEVCRRVSWRPGTAVLHCSGATPLAALASAEPDGARIGGFHPLQMFANPTVALAGLAGCTVAIEADEGLVTELEELARRIGMTPRLLPSGARARYHASAYYVGPFAIALLREAVAIWQSFGATEAEALAALSPLLKGTLEAARDRGLAGGMGGCVARGDIGTVRAHLQALDALGGEVGRLYRTLAQRTVPLAVERGSITQDVADTIVTLLDKTAISQ